MIGWKLKEVLQDTRQTKCLYLGAEQPLMLTALPLSIHEVR